MHPVLFNVFGYPVHLYAVMIAVGFIAGIWMTVRYGERVGLDRDMLLDLAWWVLVSGLVGSRLAFIAVNWDQYYYPCVDYEYFNQLYPDDKITEPDCWRLLKFWNGGLVFLGGVVCATLTIVWFVRREKIEVLKVTDTVIPALAIGQFFGRMGCLAAGCCWGKPTDVAWGIQFPKRTMVHQQHVENGWIDGSHVEALHIHPTQLYDSLAGLILVALLLWVRQRKRFHGQVFITWMFVYPIFRGTIEMFRGDTERGFIFKYISEPLNQFLGLPAGSATFLSTSQFISLLIMLTAAILWFWQTRKLKARQAAREPVPEA